MPLTLAKMKTLMIDVQPSSIEDHASNLELKPLPHSLRYEFPSLACTYPMIINTNLSVQVNSPLRIFRLHRKAIGYTFDDLKGIHPSVCMHCILVKDDHKFLIECQRRLNLNMQEVLKKEILILFKADIIHPVFDSNG